MAARITLAHKAQVRERIQTSQLINRLQASALGEVELTQTQLKSIEILLRKTLPDLSTVTIEGNEDRPLVHAVRREVVRPPSSNG